MWKFVVVLLLTAFAILAAQLVSAVIQTRVGGDPDARRRGDADANHLRLRRCEGVGVPHAEERPQGRVSKHEAHPSRRRVPRLLRVRSPKAT